MKTNVAPRGTHIAEAAPIDGTGRGALAALALAMLLASLGTSIANVSLPTLAEAFGASFQAVQWVVLAYLVAVTATIVSAGRLGDLWGRKRLLVAGLGVFTLASVGCGLAPNLGVLMAARAAQGLGAAAMMALALALVGEIVPKPAIGRAMGLLGTMSAVGTALGPSLGGVLIGGAGWRAIFLINIPLGAGALLLARHHLPADRRGGPASRERFDGAGTVLLAVTLSAYALAMTLGRGRPGLFNVALLAVALVVAGIFVLVETRVAAPLVQLRIVRERATGAGLLTSGLVATVIMSTLVVGPFYLSRGLGLASAAVGMVLSIGPVVAAIAGIPAGRLTDRLGADRVTLLGLAGMVAGTALLALLPVRVGVVGYVLPIVLVTASYALFQTANNTAVMRDIPAEERGAVSGLLNLSRNLGLVSGAAMMGAVFSLAVGSTDITHADPAAVGIGMRVTYAVAAVLLTVASVVAVRGRERGAVRSPPPVAELARPAA